MYELLHDDRAFNPLVLKCSLGTEEINHHDDISSSSSSSSSSSIPKCQNRNKSTKRKGGELVDYLKEKDDKFLVAFKDTQEKQKQNN